MPNKPSKLRVYVWRKLKAVRAEQLLEGLYALPLTEKTTEQLEWLGAEVHEMGGTAVLWAAECLSDVQHNDLIARFKNKVSEGYRKIQESLIQQPDSGQQEWLDSIIKLYTNLRYHDYFNVYQNFEIHTLIEKKYLDNKRRGEVK